METAIITSAGKQIGFKAPFNPQFLTEFKSAVDWRARKWDKADKVWLVDENEADQAIEVAARFFTIQDMRGKTAEEAEDAALEAEIAQIEANRQYILDNAEHIKEVIAALEDAVSRYSFQSKSGVKGRMARDKALLWHTLRNAKMPLEQLTELEVRGLGAAVRLLETNSIRQLTARS